MMQVGSFDHLIMVAHEEMAAAQGESLEALQAGARSVPVTLNSARIPALWQTALRQIRWVCFLGELVPLLSEQPSAADSDHSLSRKPLGIQAASDEVAYREEIRITYLHELGHYFGMDEDDLEARGLD